MNESIRDVLRGTIFESKKIVAYHGGPKPIKRFSTSHGAQGVMWFSENKSKILSGESGALSTKWLMTVELRVNKTAGWDLYDKWYLQQIKDEGYDSIKLDDDWIVFDPSRVKVVKVERTS